VSALEAVLCVGCKRWRPESQCDTLWTLGGAARCYGCSEESWLAESEREEGL
jgi:hypothetical protein